MKKPFRGLLKLQEDWKSRTPESFAKILQGIHTNKKPKKQVKKKRVFEDMHAGFNVQSRQDAAEMQGLTVPHMQYKLGGRKGYFFGGPATGVQSNAAGTIGSVMQGAGGIASMFPGIGTAVGAGLSLVGGLVSSNARPDIPVEMPTNTNPYGLAFGGKKKMRGYAQGGQLAPLSNTAVEVNADNPNMTDSVSLPNADVDHGEVITDNEKVFSNKIINPSSGNTFAEDEKKNQKALGKFEKMRNKIGDNEFMDSRYLKENSNTLFKQQENIATKLGLREKDGSPIQVPGIGKALGGFMGYNKSFSDGRKFTSQRQFGGPIKDLGEYTTAFSPKDTKFLSRMQKRFPQQYEASKADYMLPGKYKVGKETLKDDFMYDNMRGEDVQKYKENYIVDSGQKKFPRTFNRGPNSSYANYDIDEEGKRIIMAQASGAERREYKKNLKRSYAVGGEIEDPVKPLGKYSATFHPKDEKFLSKMKKKFPLNYDKAKSKYLLPGEYNVGVETLRSDHMYDSFKEQDVQKFKENYIINTGDRVIPRIAGTTGKGKGYSNYEVDEKGQRIIMPKLTGRDKARFKQDLRKRFASGGDISNIFRSLNRESILGNNIGLQAGGRMKYQHGGPHFDESMIPEGETLMTDPMYKSPLFGDLISGEATTVAPSLSQFDASQGSGPALRGMITSTDGIQEYGRRAAMTYENAAPIDVQSIDSPDGKYLGPQETYLDQIPHTGKDLGNWAERSTQLPPPKGAKDWQGMFKVGQSLADVNPTEVRDITQGTKGIRNPKSPSNLDGSATSGSKGGDDPTEDPTADTPKELLKDVFSLKEFAKETPFGLTGTAIGAASNIAGLLSNRPSFVHYGNIGGKEIQQQNAALQRQKGGEELAANTALLQGRAQQAKVNARSVQARQAFQRNIATGTSQNIGKIRAGFAKQEAQMRTQIGARRTAIEQANLGRQMKQDEINTKELDAVKTENLKMAQNLRRMAIETQFAQNSYKRNKILQNLMKTKNFKFDINSPEMLQFITSLYASPETK